MSNIKNLLEKLDTLSKPSNSPSAKKMIKEADGQPSYTGAQVGAKLDRMKDRLERRSPYKTYDQTPDFQFTPAQLQWLGNANKKDPSIIARMPSRLGPKPPVSYFAQGADQTRAQQVNYGDQNVARLRGQGREQVRAAGRFPTASGAERTATSSATPSPAVTSSDTPADTASTPTGAIATPVPEPTLGPVVTTIPPVEVQPELKKPDYSLGGARLGGSRVEPPTTAPAASTGNKPETINDILPGMEPGEFIQRMNPAGQLRNLGSPPSPGAVTPTQKVGPQSSVGRSNRNMALNRNFSTSNMAENYDKKHSAAEKLARKYEIYLENRFDIIESNYVPKKKELR